MKKFENQLIFGEVMGKTLLSFFDSQYCCKYDYLARVTAAVVLT